MTELIEMLELLRAPDGTLMLNAEQSYKLIKFMKTVHVAMRQQDVLVKNLKRIIEPEGQTHGTESEA